MCIKLKLKERTKYFLSLTILGIIGTPITIINASNDNWGNLSLPVVIVFALLLVVGATGLIFNRKR